MTENWKRRCVGLALGGSFVTLVLIGLTGRDQPPAVEVVHATRQKLNAAITSNGKVEPISPYVMQARFPTFVEKVSAAEGQAVRRGQVILALQAADERALLAQARASLIAAESDLKNAQAGGAPDQVAQVESDLKKEQLEVADLQRKQQALKQLLEKQATTQAEVAANELQLERAWASLQVLQTKKDDLARRAALDTQRAALAVQQARDQIAALEAKVASATIVSPVDGTLYSLPVHVGDYVKVGDVLAAMADLRRVQVRAFVDEPDLGWLAPHQPVQITWDALEGHLWNGETVQIPKQVVARNTRSVGEVLCSVDNSKLELLPNVNVEVRILVRERPNALVVPRAAVRTDDGRRYVFLLDGDRVHKKEINVGIASATMYEVLAGVSEGDPLALPGDLGLRDGMAVRPTESK